MKHSRKSEVSAISDSHVPCHSQDRRSDSIKNVCSRMICLASTHYRLGLTFSSNQRSSFAPSYEAPQVAGILPHVHLYFRIRITLCQDEVLSHHSFASPRERRQCRARGDGQASTESGPGYPAVRVDRKWSPDWLTSMVLTKISLNISRMFTTSKLFNGSPRPTSSKQAFRAHTLTTCCSSFRMRRSTFNC